jgi:hypothetical protein
VKGGDQRHNDRAGHAFPHGLQMDCSTWVRFVECSSKAVPFLRKGS